MFLDSHIEQNVVRNRVLADYECIIVVLFLVATVLHITIVIIFRGVKMFNF